MNEIQRYGSPFDEIRRVDERGEHWSARELQTPLGYDQWRRFEDSIERAMAAAENSGIARRDHFADAGKMIEAGKGAVRWIQDYRLTRYGAYLVAMNGDPRKPEIAAAQTYFAVKTREAETTSPRPAIPTHSEALRGWADEIERREEAERRAKELEGPAHSWNVLASGRGDYAVRDAAKILSRDPGISLGERDLFGELADLGWIHRQRSDNRWRAYQRQVDTGRLSELPQKYENPETGELTLGAPQVRITVKGLRELHRRLGGVWPLQVDTQLSLIQPT